MKTIKRGYTSGVWDLFHAGHLRSINIAASHCDYLIVGVASDASCKEYKRAPIIPFAQRMEIIGELAVVDKVIECPNYPTEDFYKQHKIDVCVQGNDDPEFSFYEVARKLGMLKIVDYQDITSTTEIIKRIKERE